MRLALSLALLTLLLAAALWGLTGLRGSEAAPRASLSPVEALSGEGAHGYARVLAPREFRFPEDHGPHPAYRTEWWYLTGHLESSSGEEFGFQVTFFRNAVAPEPPTGRSEWATNQVYMAHFALSDVSADRHRAFERLGRGAAGIAGAEVGPFRVWVENWRMESVGEGELFPLRLWVAEDGIELRLEVLPGKPVVLQGRQGFSPKGGEPGNASHYYSFTRLPIRGELRKSGSRLEVRGEAWMDREWSTSALEEGHVGWDWFSVQLDDGRDLMYFELRREDGRPDPFDYGVLVEEDGSYRTLEGSEVELSVSETWTSPLDGTVYPSGWRLRVPTEGLDLRLAPRIRDQEMNLSFRYWEGAVSVEGEGPDGSVRGRGYVELTGYAEEAARTRSPDS